MGRTGNRVHRYHKIGFTKKLSQINTVRFLAKLHRALEMKLPLRKNKQTNTNTELVQVAGSLPTMH